MNCIIWFITEVDSISPNFSNLYTLCELEIFNDMIDNYHFISRSFSTGDSSMKLKSQTLETQNIFYGKFHPNWTILTCIFYDFIYSYIYSAKSFLDFGLIFWGMMCYTSCLRNI